MVVASDPEDSDDELGSIVVLVAELVDIVVELVTDMVIAAVLASPAVVSDSLGSEESPHAASNTSNLGQDRIGGVYYVRTSALRSVPSS